MADTLYVCLGKTGDIINLLPFLKFEADEGRRSALLTSRRYAPVLDGVSYVDPVIWEGEWNEIIKAVEQHRKGFATVKVCQTANTPNPQKIRELCKNLGIDVNYQQPESFAKEQWILAGAFTYWKHQLPLVFDQRNTQREQELLARYASKKKLVLVYLGGPHGSSPYPYRAAMWEVINLRFNPRHYTVVDLAKVSTERFYDLLAFYELAWCLITIDSAPLHLAYAVPTLPVIALIQDRPTLWHGSPWRPQHACHMRYGCIDRLPDLLDSLAFIGQPGSRHKLLPKPYFAHVWSTYHMDEQVLPRHSEAKPSWLRLYRSGNWFDVRVDYGAFGRDTANVFKDHSTRYPFLKDLIRAAMLATRDGDVIVLTKPDAEFLPGLQEVLDTVTFEHPICAHRMLRFDNGSVPMVHSAVDLFAFTRAWWRRNQHQCPDLVAGSDPHWHRVLKELILLEGGSCFLNLIQRKPGQLYGVPKSHWRPYNEKIAQAWLTEHGVDDARPPVHTQKDMRRLNPHATYPFGYNPTIAEAGTGFIVAYRSHRWGDERTCLAMAELDESFNVRHNSWMGFPHSISSEDPRFFRWKNHLWMSYVQSNWPEKPTVASVHFGRVIKSAGGWGLEDVHSLPGRNPIEKNWIFWEGPNNRLFCIYQCFPEHIVWELNEDGSSVEREHVSGGVSWNWGTAKGGTSPVLVNGRFVRLFHSRTETDPAPIRWRYHLGAMEIQSAPPYGAVKVGNQPILSASMWGEVDKNACAHTKNNVLFPGNWILFRDGFLVSLGVNDDSSYLFTLSPEELSL